MFGKTSVEGYTEILPGVRLKTLVHGERTQFTEVRLVKGAVIPTHHHAPEQTGYMVSGVLRFTVGEKVVDVGPGDSWNIPANTPHAAEALEYAVVVEIFSPPREDYLALAQD